MRVADHGVPRYAGTQVMTRSHAFTPCPVAFVPYRSGGTRVWASREIRSVIPFMSRDNPTDREFWGNYQTGRDFLVPSCPVTVITSRFVKSLANLEIGLQNDTDMLTHEANHDFIYFWSVVVF